MPIATTLNHTINCFKDYEGHNITLTLLYYVGNDFYPIPWMTYFSNNYSMVFDPVFKTDIKNHYIKAIISDT